MTVLLVVRSKQQHMMLFSPLAALAHSTRSDPLAPKEVLAYPLINPPRPPPPSPFSQSAPPPTATPPPPQLKPLAAVHL